MRFRCYDSMIPCQGIRRGLIPRSRTDDGEIRWVACMPVIPYPKAVGSVAGLPCSRMLIGRQLLSHSGVCRFESGREYQKGQMMTEPIVYEFECYTCYQVLNIDRSKVTVELDEGYSRDDHWWIHRYLIYCPNCKEERSFDLLTEDADCCW